jgi:hypothetical protein
VRLRGRILPDGVYVDLLTVQAPSGAGVKVSCEGRSCRLRSEQRRASAAVLRVRRFERRFAPGAMLRIAVTMPARIGKLTIFIFRHTRAPDRHDTCLAVGSVRRAIRCPAA